MPHSAPSEETSEIAVFPEHALPQGFSIDRTTRAQLLRIFAHHREPGLPADFD